MKMKENNLHEPLRHFLKQSSLLARLALTPAALIPKNPINRGFRQICRLPANQYFCKSF